MKQKISFMSLVAFTIIQVQAQEKVDSLKKKNIVLKEVTIIDVRAIKGMGYLGESSNHINYSGKKTEVILLDSLDSNTAQNNPRQVLGRIPGANYSETEGSGFPTNGIGFRGLNPSQSIETNTRQNGYNIAADLYGYPESYYLPPLEAVERIEVIRGSSSLQFGSQFGGVINYVLKKGNPNKRFEFTSKETAGSFGFVNAYNAVGGQIGKMNYFSFIELKRNDGWRPNSSLKQFSGFGGLSYQASAKLKLGLEYSILRNRIQMPGGFTDAQFNVDSRASYRSRNWISSPWNVITAKADYQISGNTFLSLTNALNLSGRSLVWRNEDGGPSAPDDIDPITKQYVNREVENEKFNNNTTELRFFRKYKSGNFSGNLAAGIRGFYGKLHRQGGGEGTTGTDYDLTLVASGYEYDLNFYTTNIAPFIENTFKFGKLSVTPGLRYEFIQSSVKGYNPSENHSEVLQSDYAQTRSFLLGGLGLQYNLNYSSNLYGNITQAYRPIDYSSLTPLGSIAKVNPDLKDSKGFNVDAGFRGILNNYLNYDISLFYLRYNDRIGVIEKTDQQGNPYPFRTNIADSEHKGIESYLELNLTKWLSPMQKNWGFSIFNSNAFIDAKYISGEYMRKQVEYAPKLINRSGITGKYKNLSATYLLSYTSKSFGDASNAVTPSADAVAGLIPSYTVMDLALTLRLRNVNFKAGLNNLTDERYFTKRTDEYPGPGIIPSIGRSFYIGLGFKL
ncbi:MAG: TonB-dependent receptor plug domain-containing protein [Bacteroidetes bacterium]|nr:TonB-dependent receptor plug domain-containing protein [Bacteroidota bacterium]MBU1371950.1 TonB-dependent receptor plug domain-containing protein [Bacteroidota bacterium]MBU1483552.1 TonB-dependent receptor plug domain-containing protein [Bacteroidota bacterium]MBU1761217.1 TonB-dependent receptor plug domain-containing protein [Bacteroidota bacterium]MBU2268270.1 TonB-dependent receptor plug domain-containing protein [Bacteroidota bacterium]